MYRYSISLNTWTTMAPTTARTAGTYGAGFTANWIGKTGNINWANESNIQDGRYIYSTRGNNAFTFIDRFDIAGGTAGAGAWAQLNIQGNAESSANMSTGTQAVTYNNLIIFIIGIHHFFQSYLPFITHVIYGLDSLYL